MSKGRIVTAIIIAATVVGFAWSALDQPGGPARETTGVVQTVAGLSSTGESGPSERVATVLLADGSTVKALVLDAALVKPGQPARVLVYQRVLSRGTWYEVTGSLPTAKR